VTTPDKSNGYEEIAAAYIAGRGQSVEGVGASVVADWSGVLPTRASVLDLGCGNGVPITRVFIDHGFEVYAVDASPSMVAAFRAGFPGVPVHCAAVEDFDFFGRTFDAVVAWGVFFLLDEDTQRRLIAKIAAALQLGGRLLFTATRQSATWLDAKTGRPSLSLGEETYRDVLQAEGFSFVRTMTDGGDNVYYDSQKR